MATTHCPPRPNSHQTLTTTGALPPRPCDSRLSRISGARRIRHVCLVKAFMINRRGFLSSFAVAAGAAGALGLPPKWGALLENAGLDPGDAQEAPKLPDRALYDSNEE